MSVVFNYNNLRLIDHGDFITRVYTNVVNELCVSQRYSFDKKLFCIKSTRKRLKVDKKRPIECDQILEEVSQTPNLTKVNTSNRYLKF